MVAIAEIPANDGASAKDCGSCNPNGHCGNGLEKVYPTCAVRYGHMNLIGEFRYAPGMLFGCGQKVVIQTERGTEVGQQASLTCSGCSKSIDREQIKTYVKNSGPDFMRLHAGRIIRAASPQDLTEDGRQKQIADQMIRESKAVVRRLDLPMKMVICEYLFGGERAIFYFMSESRVDFRELVHELASMYHTRIELRQVGARDEARAAADYEICGRECCCKNFLKTLRPVSMSMAKLQKATLDPSKVSGRCGRLRCCLRYEHESYVDMNQKLPRVGVRVRTTEGVGIVTDRQVLTQLLLIEYPDNRRVTVPIEEILETGVAAPPPVANDARQGPPAPGGRPAGPPPRREPRDERRPRAERRPQDAQPSSSGAVEPRAEPPREQPPTQPPTQADRPSPNRPSGDRPPSDAPRRDRHRRRRRGGPRPDRPRDNPPPT